MPRESWRDHPEYLALWRESRQSADDRQLSLVLADWLEEHGHLEEMWRERVRAFTGRFPVIVDGILRAGYVPIGQGAWQMLLAATVPDHLLIHFDCNIHTYRHLTRFGGRCGWNLGMRDWPSPTERNHLRAIPRLEMLACRQMTADSWRWTTASLPGLTYLELDGPQIEAADLARLKMLPALRHLTLDGRAAQNTTALTTLPNLRHLALGPYTYQADRIQELAPNAESLLLDMEELGESLRWPQLRSLQMSHFQGEPTLSEGEQVALSQYVHLERVKIRCRNVSAAGVQALATLPRLRELTLHGEDVFPSLEALARCSSLESLTLLGDLQHEHVHQIGQIAGLRHLSLSQVTLADAEIAVLANQTSLESLRLAGLYHGQQAPVALVELPHLERLELQNLTMNSAFPQRVQGAAPRWMECVVAEA